MNRAFGAEIELTGVSREHALRVLRLLRFDIRDEVRNHTTRTWWKIVSDGSVDDGFELVSPILRGHEGVEALKTAVMALDDAGGRVDRRCGLHVHIDGRGLQLREFRSIISRYAQYEEQIDAFMPPSRRGNNNSFCKSLRPISGSERFSQAGNITELIDAQPDRRYKINLKPYLTQGSIEFRQHAGTLNAIKIHNWLGFLDGFVQESLRLARPGAGENPPDRELPSLPPKLAALANMLMETPQGLSCTALQAQLGIQAHSLRANMTYLRQKGIQVEGIRLNGETHYRVIGAVREQVSETGLFAGVAPDVARFYHNRALVLNANAQHL